MRSRGKSIGEMEQQKDIRSERIEEIKHLILAQVAKSKIGRDHVDPFLLDGLSCGLFIAELTEQEEAGSGAVFLESCGRIARVLHIDMHAIVDSMKVK